MTVITERYISCDGCGYNAADLDRLLSAAEQRKIHSGSGGWKQVGSRDYCEACVAQGLHRKACVPVALTATTYTVRRTTNPTTDGGAS